YIPGFGGTFAQNESAAGLTEWYTNRGLEPAKLALEPFTLVNQNIIKSLENVGYVSNGPGRNLFVGLWDWRLPISRTDSNAVTAPDGVLTNASVSTITDNVFATGLDYFGNLLAQVKTLYPTATKVDVIAHGAGGLIARSYIQSNVYAQGGLPAIDDLVMVGVPNQGVADAWNLIRNNWETDATPSVTSQIVKRSYDLLRSGTAINLVGVPGSTISDPNTSPITFTQQYVGSLRQLLPTYAAVDENNDGAFEQLSNSVPAGNTFINNLLTDLNTAPASPTGPDSNAWLNRVGRTHIVYSTEVDTNDRLIRRVGPSPDGFSSDELRSFTNITGISPTASQVWYESVSSDHGGDGVVSSFSTIDPFLEDPRIGGKLRLTPIKSAAAGGDVGHNELLVHPLSQTRILSAVGATNFTTANLETSLYRSAAASAAKTIELSVVRPGDALREASLRFKDFLTQAKSQGPLGGTMAYVNTQLATLLPIEELWQDRVIAPLSTLLNANASATMAQIAAALGPAVTVQTDTTDEKSLRFTFNATHFTGGIPSINVGGLNLGASASLSTGGFAFAGNLRLEGVLGLDLTQSDDFGQSLFVRDLFLELGGTASIPNLNTNITLGGVTASIESGRFNLDAKARVALQNPQGGSQLSLDNIIDGLTDISSLVSITPTASLDLRLPLNLTNSATNFNLANFGRPIVSAASQNLFAGTPDIVVDIEIGPVIQDQLLNVMASLDATADRITNQAILNKVIPGVGQSLNGLLRSSPSSTAGWGDLIKLEQTARDYFSSFDPSSQNFLATNVGRKPSVLDLRNTLANKLQQVSSAGFSIGGGASPISLSGGLDLATNKLTFMLKVDGSFSRDFNFDLDALDVDWNKYGVDFDANAQINVSTDIDLQAQFGVGLSRTTGIDPFFSLDRFQINASVDGAGSSLGFGLANGTVTGTVTATSLLIAAGASIALVNSAAPLSDRLSITPTGNLDLNFAFNASLFGSALGTAPNLPTIRIEDTNLFDTVPPTFTPNMGSLELSLSSDIVVGALVKLAEWLDSASGSSLLATKIPLVNKTIGEVLSSAAQPRQFESYQILELTAPTIDNDLRQFSARLNTAGRSAASIGIRPGDVVTFLATNGERYDAQVATLEDELVTIEYPASRTDLPDLINPSLTFQIGGTLADTLRAALAKYSDPSVLAPSLGDLLNELAGPLGINFADIDYDSTSKLLTFTPTFTPKPIQFKSKLDFGDEIPGLSFSASGDFLISAAPSIRLPLEINLSRDPLLTATNRVAVIDDALPEINLAITAQLDNPQARASLGFLTVRLSEDGTANNDGVKFTTNLSLNIKDPGIGAAANGRATISELITPANLANTFIPGVNGAFDLDGLVIRPELAGTVIPGSISIFTTETVGGV
ncbi:MAG: hypothetical protein IT423_22025, partial [Pirellulaceae bacterium]|nr:hypothetical protein [Pirellulaceae bacterium]